MTEFLLAMSKRGLLRLKSTNEKSNCMTKSVSSTLLPKKWKQNVTQAQGWRNNRTYKCEVRLEQNETRTFCKVWAFANNLFVHVIAKGRKKKLRNLHLIARNISQTKRLTSVNDHVCEWSRLGLGLLSTKRTYLPQVGGAKLSISNTSPALADEGFADGGEEPSWRNKPSPVILHSCDLLWGSLKEKKNGTFYRYKWRITTVAYTT